MPIINKKIDPKTYTISRHFSTKCSKVFYNPIHAIRNGKYYRNGAYFGDITLVQDNTVQVLCKNGNKYMDGETITLKIIYEPIEKKTK